MTRRNPHLLVATIFAAWLLLAAAVAVAGPCRVAVLPFAINSQKDLTFLENDIFDLLTTRLQWPGRVVVIGRKETAAAMGNVAVPLDDAGARAVGLRLGAQYVLCGSLTLFGDRISIDFRVIDASGRSPTLVGHQLSRGAPHIISGINGFATEINRTVFGRP